MEHESSPADNMVRHQIWEGRHTDPSTPPLQLSVPSEECLKKSTLRRRQGLAKEETHRPEPVRIFPVDVQA